MSDKQYCEHGFTDGCNRCAMAEAEIVPATVHLHVVLDISTSMKARWPQTISGLNEYIDSLRQDPNPCKVTITKFGQEYEVQDLYTDAGLDDIKKFDAKAFYPNGQGTALWGAVGLSLKKINTTEPVLFVVITDGEENCSHTYTSESVNKLIEERQKLGNYTFAYLGVDKAAWGQEAQVHAFAASSHNVAAHDYGASTYHTLSTSTAGYRSTMAHNSMRGMAMNVSSLFNPATQNSGELEDATFGAGETATFTIAPPPQTDNPEK